jgi:hypothetical protein
MVKWTNGGAVHTIEAHQTPDVPKSNARSAASAIDRRIVGAARQQMSVRVKIACRNTLWQFMRENWLSNRVFKSYDGRE